jgi:hypothetical protein
MSRCTTGISSDHQWQTATGINDTSGKFATHVVVTSGKY